MDHCSFTDPRKTEGWVGLVGWPIADTLPMKWSHVNHIIIEDYKTERNFDGMFSEERFDNFAENQIGRPKISTKHLTISLRKKHVFRKRLPHTWVRMHSTAPTKYLHQCVTTAFRWQEDADCPPNIQLFRRQDFCGCCSKRLEQFAVGLNEKPICHTPGSGGCRKHFIWTARPRRIVDGINCAVWKYFYLLTFLLTYHARFCFEKNETNDRKLTSPSEVLTLSMLVSSSYIRSSRAAPTFMKSPKMIGLVARLSASNA